LLKPFPITEVAQSSGSIFHPLQAIENAESATNVRLSADKKCHTGIKVASPFETALAGTSESDSTEVVQICLRAFRSIAAIVREEGAWKARLGAAATVEC
jgi:hypothetical protein